MTTHATRLQTSRGLDCAKIGCFFSWASLRNEIANLILLARQFKKKNGESSKNETKPQPLPSTAELEQASKVIVGAVQGTVFATKVKALSSDGENRTVRKDSNLLHLDPFVNPHGLLCVGGHLRNSTLAYQEKHPVLLPKGHHVSVLIVRHFHEKIHHQGRQITHGAFREADYWVIGGHRMVAVLIESCVICKRLRGTMMTQHMANLLPDRMETSPQFSNVGLDVFEPWEISTGRLRGGSVNAKRWGLIFTCLSSRAIQIKILETMDASSFTCAVRCFFALHGPVMKFRCDHGTNFVGGKSQLHDALLEMDQTQIQKFTAEHGCEWTFNPPHASHFSGVWECQIRTVRHILDAMLVEVTGIVNS